MPKRLAPLAFVFGAAALLTPAEALAGHERPSRAERPVHHAPARHHARPHHAHPAPAPIWVPGYWTFNVHLGHTVWVEGSYQLPPAEGMVWVSGYWADTGHGRHWVAGYWR